MEKLIVLSEEGVSQEFPLTEQITSIGRDEQNSICLGDKSVSRHHATVQRVFRGFTIQDEGSTNGTRVNGRPINKQFLRHSDLIEIGNYQLRFMEALPRYPLDDDADKTMVLRPAPSPQATRGSATAAVARPETASDVTQPKESAIEEAGQMTARVVFLAGALKGEARAVDRSFFSVGNPGADLVLINKRHTGYFLLKVGGDVPPTINGTPIRAGGVQLHDGDRIELGKLSLEFRL